MVSIDMTGKVVLITGGTKGIGKAAALWFGRAGARCYLTYKWGSADQAALSEEFAAAGAPRPVLVEADVSVDEHTDRLLEVISGREQGVDVFISNVGFAQRTMSLADYRKRSLFKTLEYSTWPLIEYTRKIHTRFGRYPRHVVGISSDGPDHFYRGYDFVAASKALLEFFGRYLSMHLFEEGSPGLLHQFGGRRGDIDQVIGVGKHGPDPGFLPFRLELLAFAFLVLPKRPPAGIGREDLDGLAPEFFAVHHPVEITAFHRGMTSYSHNSP